MSYQLLQIRRERGHCSHPLHTLFLTVLGDPDVVGCSGRINNEAPKKKKKKIMTVTISGGVMFGEDAVNIVHVSLCCWLSAVPWCFSLAPLVSFKDHLYLHLLLLCCVCMCVFVYAHTVGLQPCTPGYSARPASLWPISMFIHLFMGSLEIIAPVLVSCGSEGRQPKYMHGSRN